MPQRKYYYGVLAYFKNERHILEEWIQHYKTWGADHIWLIDNGSQDNYDITTYQDQNYVTVYHEPDLGQVKAYNKYLPELRKLVKWLGVFDLDEFLYSKKTSNIKRILKTLKPTVNAIKIQMSIFLPATLTHPPSIVKSNTLKSHSDSIKHPKCLFNLDKCSKLEIHGGKINPKYCLSIRSNSGFLAINHYRYGSFQYLYGIKEGRGGGVSKNKYNHLNKFMNIDYYIKNNNITKDTYLKNQFEKKHNTLDSELNNHKFIEPMVELYPNSSWLYLQEKESEKYQKFTNYQKDQKDTCLTFSQIQEISLALNKIVKERD